MKKLSGIVVFAFLLCAALVSCRAPANNAPRQFKERPSLTLANTAAGLRYAWTHSEPEADSYDVYYIKGVKNRAEILDDGYILADAAKQGILQLYDINNGDIVSAIVTAIRSGFNDTYSSVCQITVNLQNSPGGGTEAPGDDPDFPSLQQRKSVKRGVGYNFKTLRKGQNNNVMYTARDMDLLMSGTSGICWFYNWGVPGSEDTVEIEARNRGLEFAPMTWNNNYQEVNYKNYAQRNPATKYLLAFNEPNFRYQSNMTPQQAANVWPRLRTLAKEANLKIISPAMNYSGGNESMGWDNPIAWLDEFRKLIGEDAWAEIEGIAVHLYAWWPNVVNMNPYRKYDKKLWLTEFCGWEDLQNRTPSYELQAWYMSQAIVYLEADPLVARYAWYLPKGHEVENASPFHNLITEVNAGTEPDLTNLGVIYTNIPSLDNNIWYSADEKIDASQFMNSNLAVAAQTGGWSESVLFRPVTDSDKSAGALEIHDFKQNMWVEYQIDVKTAKTYTLNLRYNAAANTGLIAKIDNNAEKGQVVNSAGAWATAAVDLGNLAAGRYTLRLRVSSGSCALNWLRLE